MAQKKDGSRRAGAAKKSGRPAPSGSRREQEPFFDPGEEEPISRRPPAERRAPAEPRQPGEGRAPGAQRRPAAGVPVAPEGASWPQAGAAAPPGSEPTWPGAPAGTDPPPASPFAPPPGGEGAPTAPPYPGPGSFGPPEGAPPGAPWLGASGEPVAPADEPPAYRMDLPVGACAALLAVLVFLPWYRAAGAFEGSAPAESGWSSGAWGPIIFFLALASLALIVLRRLKVRVALPIEEPLVHEAFGWAIVVMVIIKSWLVPTVHGLYAGETTFLLWVALAAGFGLIFFGGKMAPTSLVLLPGWFRGQAGMLGIAILGVAILGGAAFGIANSPGGPAPGRADQGLTPAPPEIVEGALHRCAEEFEFPVPDGVEVQQSFETPMAGGYSTCGIRMESGRGIEEVTEAFQMALDTAGWEYTLQTEAVQGTVMTLEAPTCGNLLVIPARMGPPEGPEAGDPADAEGLSIVAVLYDCDLPFFPPTDPGS